MFLSRVAPSPGPLDACPRYRVAGEMCKEGGAPPSAPRLSAPPPTLPAAPQRGQRAGVRARWLGCSSAWSPAQAPHQAVGTLPPLGPQPTFRKARDPQTDSPLPEPPVSPHGFPRTLLPWNPAPLGLGEGQAFAHLLCTPSSLTSSSHIFPLSPLLSKLTPTGCSLPQPWGRLREAVLLLQGHTALTCQSQD